MSRSTKKPYYTDQRSPRASKAKRAANKTVRRVNKAACAEDEAQTLAPGKAYTKASSSWSIRDFSFHCPKDKKAYRK